VHVVPLPEHGDRFLGVLQHQVEHLVERSHVPVSLC
jgi:hypothetical protein